MDGVRCIQRPTANEEEVTFLFNLIDRESNGRIDCLDFLDLREVCQLSLREVSAKEEGELDGVQEDGRCVKALELFGGSRLALLLCVVNSTVGCVHWYGMPRQLELDLLIAHVVLSALMVLRAVSKVVAVNKSPPRLSAVGMGLLINPGSNAVEGVDWLNVVLSAVGLVLYSWAFSRNAASASAPASASASASATVLVAHLATGVRPLLLFKQSLRTGLKLGRRLLPPMMFITLFLLCVMYFFAILGEELFSTLPSNAGYFEPFECGYGFQTFGCSMFTMYHQAVGNNWHDVMNDVVASEHAGPAAAAYFFFLYLFINLLLIDLLLAVTIEAFISALKSIARKKNQTDDAMVVMVPDTASQGDGGNRNGNGNANAGGGSSSLNSSLRTGSIGTNGDRSDDASSSHGSISSNRISASTIVAANHPTIGGATDAGGTTVPAPPPSQAEKTAVRGSSPWNTNRTSLVSIEDRLGGSLTSGPRRTSSVKKRMASTHTDDDDDGTPSDETAAAAGGSGGVARGSRRASAMIAAGLTSDLWQSVAKKAYKVTRREGFDWRRDLIQKPVSETRTTPFLSRICSRTLQRWVPSEWGGGRGGGGD